MIKALLRDQSRLRAGAGFLAVSRKTAYKWRARFLAEGARGLRPRSRRPQRMPRRLKSKWIERIRRLRQEHPTWGPKKLRAWFERAGWHPPAVRTAAESSGPTVFVGPLIKTKGVGAAILCKPVWNSAAPTGRSDKEIARLRSGGAPAGRGEHIRPHVEHRQEIKPSVRVRRGNNLRFPGQIKPGDGIEG